MPIVVDVWDAVLDRVKDVLMAITCIDQSSTILLLRMEVKLFSNALLLVPMAPTLAKMEEDNASIVRMVVHYAILTVIVLPAELDII